jgi:hypothetical protein
MAYVFFTIRVSPHRNRHNRSIDKFIPFCHGFWCRGGQRRVENMRCVAKEPLVDPCNSVGRYVGFPASAIRSGIGNVGRKLTAARSAGIGRAGLVIVNKAVQIGDVAMAVESGGFGWTTLGRARSVGGQNQNRDMLGILRRTTNMFEREPARTCMATPLSSPTITLC